MSGNAWRAVKRFGWSCRGSIRAWRRGRRDGHGGSDTHPAPPPSFDASQAPPLAISTTTPAMPSPPRRSPCGLRSHRKGPIGPHRGRSAAGPVGRAVLYSGTAGSARTTIGVRSGLLPIRRRAVVVVGGRLRLDDRLPEVVACAGVLRSLGRRCHPCCRSARRSGRRCSPPRRCSPGCSDPVRPRRPRQQSSRPPGAPARQGGRSDRTVLTARRASYLPPARQVQTYGGPEAGGGRHQATASPTAGLTHGATGAIGVRVSGSMRARPSTPGPSRCVRPR
jgi:hypothetical protein